MVDTRISDLGAATVATGGLLPVVQTIGGAGDPKKLTMTAAGATLAEAASATAQLTALGGGVAPNGTGAVTLTTSPAFVTPALGTPASGNASNLTNIPGAQISGTITGTRITPRVNTVASSATPTINTDTTDIFTITALAAAITSMTTNLSGTPTTGQSLLIRILDSGAAKTIAWGASFASRGATLPTTTVLGKYLYVGFRWNEVTSDWDCVSVAQEI